jgi:hypothetical protein
LRERSDEEIAWAAGYALDVMALVENDVITYSFIGEYSKIILLKC